MITKELQRRIAELERAEAAVEEAILDRMVEIARRMNLDEMLFCGSHATYERGGKAVVSKHLDELDNLYCDNIHECGFTGVWTPENGWDG